MKKKPKIQIKKFSPVWWIVGIGMILAVVVISRTSRKTYSPEQQIGRDSNSHVTLYKGNGYEISYERSWQLDDTEAEAPATIVSSPDGRAKVYIQPQHDPRLKSNSGKTALIKNLTDNFRQNPDYSLASTEEAKINGKTAYLVEGTLNYQGTQLEFREYTFFGESGDFYTLRINSEPGQHQKALDNLVGSFTILGPDENEIKVRSLIEKIPEVQNFRRDVEKSNRSTSGVRIDKNPDTDETYYVVQVYEVFADHTTTFNWYRVHPVSWIVERQNLATDTWEAVQ